MWLEVGATEDSMVDARQCIRNKGVAGGRKDRRLYDGRNVYAMYKEQGCGWR